MTLTSDAPTLEACESRTWIWRGQPVHYVRQGTTGQPVLLVHGFGASTDHWRHNIPALAQHNQVYAIDLMGFGRSGKPKWEYPAELWREQLRDFCQEVVQQPVVVVGNSIGGYVALSLGSDHPEWASGVVLLNSAGSFSDRKVTPKRWQQWLGSVLGWGIRQKPVAYGLFHYIRQPNIIRKNLEKVYFNKSAITDQLVEDIYRPSCDVGAVDVFAALMRSGQKGRPVDELLSKLTCPLLVIWGERDPWMPSVEVSSNSYHKHYADLEEHRLQAGHCPHDEMPEAVNPLIEDWIARRIRAD